MHYRRERKASRGRGKVNSECPKEAGSEGRERENRRMKENNESF